MVISCREVFREVSNYMDNDLDPKLKARISEHLSECEHCSAVYDGTRNVLKLICDERTFVLPEGFSERLYSKIRPTTPAQT
jgi:anti-sigma factor (TIGR02949 family)